MLHFQGGSHLNVCYLRCYPSMEGSSITHLMQALLNGITAANHNRQWMSLALLMLNAAPRSWER